MPKKPPFLSDERALRRVVKAPHVRLTEKIRPELEDGGRAWIEAARLVGVATRRPDGHVGVQLRAACEATARTLDEKRVELSDAPEVRVGDVAEGLEQHPFAGMIFMRPGVDSTLRANGQATHENGRVSLRVQETYVHCPKAFVRSKLWKSAGTPPVLELDAEHGSRLGDASQRFLARSPFALLGTCLEEGGADVSPRGDPAGFVKLVDERTLLVPDRPGNHIADSFRNILQHPSAALLFLIPGLNWTLRVTGHASITADAPTLAPLAVKGKAPRLGIWLDVVDAELAPAPALEQARIWDQAARADEPELASVGRLLVQQVMPGGRFQGAKGKLVDFLLERDAKKNLY